MLSGECLKRVAVLIAVMICRVTQSSAKLRNDDPSTVLPDRAATVPHAVRYFFTGSVSSVPEPSIAAYSAFIRFAPARLSSHVELVRRRVDSGVLRAAVRQDN